MTILYQTVMFWYFYKWNLRKWLICIILRAHGVLLYFSKVIYHLVKEGTEVQISSCILWFFSFEYKSHAFYTQSSFKFSYLNFQKRDSDRYIRRQAQYLYCFILLLIFELLYIPAAWSCETRYICFLQLWISCNQTVGESCNCCFSWEILDTLYISSNSYECNFPPLERKYDHIKRIQTKSFVTSSEILPNVLKRTYIIDE